jgi:hypothetical protein
MREPDEPRNVHSTTPLGICILKLPPEVVAWPFWMMLPNLPVVRSRIDTV